MVCLSLYNSKHGYVSMRVCLVTSNGFKREHMTSKSMSAHAVRPLPAVHKRFLFVFKTPKDYSNFTLIQGTHCHIKTIALNSPEGKKAEECLLPTCLACYWMCLISPWKTEAVGMSLSCRHRKALGLNQF